MVTSQLQQESVGPAKIQATNLSEMTCSCTLYQQTKTPCMCANAGIILLKLVPQKIFTSRKYFSNKMSILSLQEFHGNIHGFVIPADSDIEMILLGAELFNHPGKAVSTLSALLLPTMTSTVNKDK